MNGTVLCRLAISASVLLASAASCHDDTDDGGGSTEASGGSAGANGGSAGANGGSAGANGGSAGANGGSAGANGGSAGANGGSAGANGGSAGANGGSANGGSAGTCRMLPRDYDPCLNGQSQINAPCSMRGAMCELPLGDPCMQFPGYLICCDGTWDLIGTNVSDTGVFSPSVTECSGGGGGQSGEGVGGGAG